MIQSPEFLHYQLTAKLRDDPGLLLNNAEPAELSETAPPKGKQY